MANMEEIMRETTALLQRKQASFKGNKKQALAGEDPASMPGAEHDGDIPAGSTEAQPEVKDKTMGPASARSGEGGGDDSEVTRGHATDAGEGEVPEGKPMISADADAKAARCAKIGNDLMADIRAWRTTAPAQKAAAVVAPKAVVAAVAPKADTPKVAAGEPAMELTEKVLAKIAAICLSYEDSAAMVTAALEKHAGATQAKEIIGFLSQQDDAYTKQAAEQAGYQDGMNLINEQIYAQGVAAGKSASAPVAKPQVKKVAMSADAQRIQELVQLGEKLAGAGLGDIMGALPNEQGAPMGAGPEAMDPAALAGAGPEAGGGEEFSVDDLAAALDVLVSQKQITPEDAQAIMQTVTEESSQTPMSGEGEPTGPAVPEETSETPESGEEAGEKTEPEAAEAK